MRRATLALAVTQLLSWGLLFYAFAVVAPEITVDTGWSEPALAGAFSLGLLVAGLAAPQVASGLVHRDPRVVLAAGSALGSIGMVGFATAHHLVVVYLAWVVIGLAMAATLYEPAMAVLIAIDPARRRRTLAAVTAAGGLASTAFAPLGGVLVGHLGWRATLVVLAVVVGVATTSIHALALPPATAAAAPAEPAPPAMLRSRPVRRLRAALLFEQAATMATTTHLIGLLVARGAGIALAGAVLGVMGLGKVAGRLLLLGPVVRRAPLPWLAAGCSAIQLVGLAVPLATTRPAALFASVAAVGAASGATTVLRPLLVVELVGPGPYAAVSAQLQRTTTLARAAAPLAFGFGAVSLGWPLTWTVALASFGIAAGRYRRLGANGCSAVEGSMDATFVPRPGATSERGVATREAGGPR